MLTRATFRDICESQPIAVPTFRKGSTIMLSGKVHFIMARLQADPENPITYNICNDELLAPQFGVNIDDAEIIPIAALSEKTRDRAKNFL